MSFQIYVLKIDKSQLRKVVVCQRMRKYAAVRNAAVSLSGIAV
ncbi:MAG: hypothetical protein ACLFQX_07485 [Candidatus Kapaibacterium sp.]